MLTKITPARRHSDRDDEATRAIARASRNPLVIALWKLLGIEIERVDDESEKRNRDEVRVDR